MDVCIRSTFTLFLNQWLRPLHSLAVLKALPALDHSTAFFLTCLTSSPPSAALQIFPSGLFFHPHLHGAMRFHLHGSFCYHCRTGDIALRGHSLTHFPRILLFRAHTTFWSLCVPRPFRPMLTSSSARTVLTNCLSSQLRPEGFCTALLPIYLLRRLPCPLCHLAFSKGALLFYILFQPTHPSSQSVFAPHSCTSVLGHPPGELALPSLLSSSCPHPIQPRTFHAHYCPMFRCPFLTLSSHPSQPPIPVPSPLSMFALFSLTRHSWAPPPPPPVH